MRSKKKIPINLTDVQYIMGDDFKYFEKVRKNVYCSNCTNHVTEMINFTAELNDLRDIIFRGFCKQCRHQVARYLETGESADNYQRADQYFKK